ncbi:MAG: T9SS type A sorting domain-containing protein [Cyclobacteriaceae bacterium]
MKIFYCLIFFLTSSSAFAQVSVLTQHNDLNRTGWYPHETKLTTGNVKSESFGYIFKRDVDDQIYAQPLVLMKVNIPNVGKRNVCYVATVNNSVYAFEADSANVTTPYWQVNLSPSGGRAAKNTDMNASCGAYNDFAGNMGTVGTPVIDSVTNTLYVVAKSFSSTNGFQQFLHALDVTTGAEKSGSPKLISAQINSTGSGSVGGVLNFDALKQNQRPGLLLLNGIIYITWASHGDCDPYHGWILGYDKTTLAQKIVYNATAQGEKGGIWMAGAGIAADESGNLYVAVGNGSVGLGGNPSDVTNRSESALKLTPSGSTLTLSSFFTPTNFPALEAADLDFGVTGLLLIPGTTRAVAGAKDGNIYLMDRDNMGGYNATSNQVIQTFNQNNSQAHNITSLTYYRGTQKEYMYTWSDNVPLKALPFSRTNNQFDLLNIKSSPLQGPVGYNGAFLSGSSKGSIDSTAILWTSYSANGNANQSTRPGILRALSAIDITKELWNTSMSSADDPGNYAKFNCPTIANGKVYLATFSNKLVVYGLRKGVVTGLGDNSSDKPHIHPNPAKDILKISWKKGVAVDIKIFDLTGRTFLQEESVYESESVNVSSLPNGLYLVQLKTNSSVWMEKVVIQK